MRQSPLIASGVNIGSTRWTPWLLAALALAAAAGGAGWLEAALAGAVVNLAAAIVFNHRFRGRPGLLAFHVALLLSAVLIVAARLTVLEGRVEIAAGQPFDAGDVTVVRRGPLHAQRWLRDLRFHQGRFTVGYARGLSRGRTRSSIRWPGRQDDGGERRLEAGDTVPFRLGGYRLHTTPNKGFAPQLTWTPAGGAPVTGLVHLPSFPLYDWRQSATWTTPAGTALELRIEPPVRVREDGPWTFDSASAARGGPLAVGWEAGAAVLVPGASVRLGGGTLRYDGLRAWIGYRLSFDPTLPWLLATALVGVVGLAWHVLATPVRPTARPRPVPGHALSGEPGGR